MANEFESLLKSLVGTKGVLLATDDGTIFRGEVKSAEGSMVIFDGKVDAPPVTTGVFRGTTANIAIAHIAWVVRG